MENVYIFFSNRAKVEESTVCLSDIASICCTDKALQRKLRMITVYQFQDAQQKQNAKQSGKTENRIIITALKIFEIILSQYPNLTLIPLGSTDIIIEQDISKPKKVLTFLKASCICLITFFGSLFTIMAFNNDVQVHEVFVQIFKLVTGHENDGFSVLEGGYCIGLGAGILIFYNHFGKKKLSKDPTPLEIEMRLYENDINNTLIDGVKRKNEHIDVG
jgi:stage V sporulation protein AA